MRSWVGYPNIDSGFVRGLCDDTCCISVEIFGPGFPLEYSHLNFTLVIFLLAGSVPLGLCSGSLNLTRKRKGKERGQLSLGTRPPTPIPAAQHMINGAGILDSEGSGHDLEFALNTSL